MISTKNKRVIIAGTIIPMMRMSISRPLRIPRMIKFLNFLSLNATAQARKQKINIHMNGISLLLKKDWAYILGLSNNIR